MKKENKKYIDEVVKELIGTMVAFEEMTDEKDKAEKRPKIIIEFIKQKIKEAQQRKVEEIQQDIDSVLNMLDGNTDREKIANYIREYLLTK